MQSLYGTDSGVISINIPDGYPVGAIFGKGATNIRRLQGMTRGGRVSVNQDQSPAVVTVSGPGASSVVSELEQHFASHSQHAIGAYPHPAVGKTVSLKITSASTLVSFVPFSPRGVVAVDTNRREQLYTLTRASMRPVSSGTASLGALSSALSKLSITFSKRSFYVAADQPVILKEVIEAVKAGRAFRPAFDQIKFRANLGKQFFYAPRHKYVSTSTQPYHEVQEMEIGYDKDLKAIYSNALEKNQAAAVRSHLTTMGFRPTESKKTVSLHVSDDSQGTSHVISFINASGGLKVRKLKSGDAKLVFLAELADRSVDLRFKLMGQYHFDKGSAAARKMTALADRCSLSGGVLQMPRGMGLSLSKLRHKSKEKLAGTFTGANGEEIYLHVTISLVKSSDDEYGVVDDIGHHEITIYVPALTEALNSNSISSLGTVELRQMTAFVQFFQKLEPAVPA